jgi:hypothetical protein
LIGLREARHNTAHEWKRAENRDLQAFRQSVRVDAEDPVSAVRIEKMARNRLRCWLANLGEGGAGIGDFNYPNNRREGAQKFNETIGQIPQPVLVIGICF